MRTNKQHIDQSLEISVFRNEVSYLKAMRPFL